MQPREKALHYGMSVLNDRELLKILIGSGQKNRPVDAIARDGDGQVFSCDCSP